MKNRKVNNLISGGDDLAEVESQQLLLNNQSLNRGNTA